MKPVTGIGLFWIFGISHTGAGIGAFITGVLTGSIPVAIIGAIFMAFGIPCAVVTFNNISTRWSVKHKGTPIEVKCEDVIDDPSVVYNGFFSMRLVCKDSNGEVYYSDNLNPKKAEKYIGRDMAAYVLGDAYLVAYREVPA